MLEITSGAVAALKELRTSPEIPDDADVRIQLVSGEGREGIGLTFTDAPEEGDQVVAEEGDLKIMVAGELAGPLDASVLDVRTTQEGVRLELRERGPDISGNSSSP